MVKGVLDLRDLAKWLVSSCIHIDANIQGVPALFGAAWELDSIDISYFFQRKIHLWTFPSLDQKHFTFWRC